MATARFLHAADLHLGSPLNSLGLKVSPEIHELAKKQVNTVFRNLVEVAKSEQVDFVVLAGDIYDKADRDPGARIRVNLGLRELSAAGIKVFLVHGNHDPLTPDYLSGRELPEGVFIFPAGEVTSHAITMRNGAIVRGIGADTNAFCPPLVTTDAEIGRLMDAYASALTEHVQAVGA